MPFRGSGGSIGHGNIWGNCRIFFVLLGNLACQLSGMADLHTLLCSAPAKVEFRLSDTMGEARTPFSKVTEESERHYRWRGWMASISGRVDHPMEWEQTQIVLTGGPSRPGNSTNRSQYSPRLLGSVWCRQWVIYVQPFGGLMNSNQDPEDVKFSQKNGTISSLWSLRWDGSLVDVPKIKQATWGGTSWLAQSWGCSLTIPNPTTRPGNPGIVSEKVRISSCNTFQAVGDGGTGTGMGRGCTAENGIRNHRR